MSYLLEGGLAVKVDRYTYTPANTNCSVTAGYTSIQSKGGGARTLLRRDAYHSCNNVWRRQAVWFLPVDTGS